MSGKNSVFGVLGKTFKIYLRFFHRFFLYMTFPVLGQMVGFVLILLPTLYMQRNLPLLADKYSYFAEPSKQFVLLLLVILPGLILMLSAFWKYLVAYSALNSMTQSALVSGKIYDFPAHNSFVTKNLLKFFLIWLFISFVGISPILPCFFPINKFIGILLLLVIFCLQAIIYFLLVPVFQVFTFESEQDAFGCIKRSFELVKNSIGQVAGLLVLQGLIFRILEEIIEWGGVKVIPHERIFSQCANLILNTDFIQSINSILSQSGDLFGVNYAITTALISKFILSMIISTLVWGYTLPLRSICWTLWYKNNAGSEKTPKKSYKKGGVKQLDPEILRRANLDDDEEV